MQSALELSYPGHQPMQKPFVRTLEMHVEYAETVHLLALRDRRNKDARLPGGAYEPICILKTERSSSLFARSYNVVRQSRAPPTLLGNSAYPHRKGTNY